MIYYYADSGKTKRQSPKKRRLQLPARKFMRFR